MGPTMSIIIICFVSGAFPYIHNPMIMISAIINTEVIRIKLFLMSFLPKEAMIVYGFAFYKVL